MNELKDCKVGHVAGSHKGEASLPPDVINLGAVDIHNKVAEEADDTEMLDAMRENNPDVFNAMIQGYEQEKQMPQIQEQEMGFIDLQPKKEEEVKDE